MDEVLVVKKNTAGEETWKYSGTVLQRADSAILLEALFDREDTLFHGILLRTGDRFVEAYFTRRWYNIFEMHDRDSDEIKGYYCNVSYPAQISDGRVEYIDLALDLLIYPDGRTLLLDEDEFAGLDIEAEDCTRARQAVAELQGLFTKHSGLVLAEMFDRLNGNLA